MQKSIYIKISSFIFSLIIIFCFSAGSCICSAQQSGSLTLICRKANTILTGMQWRIYYVGHQADGRLILENEFSSYPVSITSENVDEMSAAAATLENYAIVDRISPLANGLIDDQGYLTFNNLKTGYYLVSGNIYNIDEVFYQPTPALVEINTESENPDIDLVVYPKIKYALLSEINLNNVIEKHWIDNKSAHKPIDVEIYKNAEFYKTVTLNEENEWSYSWEASEYADWRVKEIIPKDYTVNYTVDNGKFIIENTFIGKDIITTKPPEKLPQTGQLWWPVFAMGGIGAICIFSGIILKGKKRKKI